MDATIRVLIGIAVMAFLLAGCTEQPEPVTQVSTTEPFALPEGDPEQGREAFLQMRCYDCHRIQGVDLPLGEEPDQAVVMLGGDVTKVKTYQELVTSIINPSHRIAQSYTKSLVSRGGVSNMTNYNDVMTVSQLIDLVAYLQKQYTQIETSPQASYPDYYR